MTPLQQAAYHGRVDCAKILLEYGASTTSRSGDGFQKKNAKEIAQMQGKVEVVRLIEDVEAGRTNVTLEEVARDPSNFTLILSGHVEHPDCNGKYVFDGTENGKPRFAKNLGATPKLFWTGKTWDCFWGGFSPEAPEDTPVPPLSGYTRDQGSNDIRVVYARGEKAGMGDVSHMFLMFYHRTKYYKILINIESFGPNRSLRHV